MLVRHLWRRTLLAHSRRTNGLLLLGRERSWRSKSLSWRTIKLSWRPIPRRRRTSEIHAVTRHSPRLSGKAMGATRSIESRWLLELSRRWARISKLLLVSLIRRRWASELYRLLLRLLRLMLLLLWWWMWGRLLMVRFGGSEDGGIIGHLRLRRAVLFRRGENSQVFNVATTKDDAFVDGVGSGDLEGGIAFAAFGAMTLHILQ